MHKCVELTDKIKYIPCRANPLSADVGILYADRTLWLYDVGRGPEILDFIQEIKNDYSSQFDNPVSCKIVLSHFHDDHIYNIKRLNEDRKLIKGIDFDEVFLSKQTGKYVDDGIVVEGDAYLENSELIHLFPIPSSHAKGCLGMEVGNYCFVGDALYPMQRQGRACYNVQFLKEEIDVLKNVEANNLLVSHHKGMVKDKNQVIKELEDIYRSRRSEDGSFVYI